MKIKYKILKYVKGDTIRYYPKVRRFGIWFWFSFTGDISLFKSDADWHHSIEGCNTEIGEYHVSNFERTKYEVVAKIRKEK